MVSFLNGLSQLGAGVSAFAGSAGLEQQKSDLARQSLVLADQLATTRESAGRQEAGQIAATAAEKEHGFLGTQGDLNRQTQLSVAQTSAGATLGAAGISAAASKYSADAQSTGLYAQIAALAPGREQEILASKQKAAFEAVQTQNAQDLRTAHAALAAEMGKPDADPTKVSALKSQVTSRELSASTEAATTTAASAMYRTDMDSVQHFNTQLVTATAALNSPEMTDVNDRAAQRGLIADLKTQLTGAQRALAYSSNLVHGRVGSATDNPAPGVAPTPPAGVPAGARYSPSMKIWQGPDGRLFDAQGQPTTAPGTAPKGFMNNGAGGP